MLFNDALIRRHGRDLINPFVDDRVQPASYDVTLGRRITTLAINAGSHGRTWEEGKADTVTDITELADGMYRIPSYGFVLAETAETVTVPPNIAARIEGKSSIGRHGLLVHSTAGFIDPGFRGVITLELFNAQSYPLVVRAGQRIAQLWFHQLVSPAERPYGSPGLGSRYQDQAGPTPARGE